MGQFQTNLLDCFLDVQKCLEIIYIALDKSLCAKTAFKYEYQVLHLNQMFSGEWFQWPWPLIWERVANPACHLFILWLFNCICRFPTHPLPPITPPSSTFFSAKGWTSYMHVCAVTGGKSFTLVLLNPDIHVSCLCKQCRSRSVGFWRSQLIWIWTVCH